MSIKDIKRMKDQLMSCVQTQLNDLQNVNTHELGEAVDMIKDLSEAIYYCTITEAMEKTEEPEMNSVDYYTTPSSNYRMMYSPSTNYRNRERDNGYMYYPNSGSNVGMNSGNSNTSYYTEMPYDMMRDPREGRAALRRRMYMEGKETHNDPNSQMKELEAYLQELSTDITEMIRDASPEEKATLHQKMTMLANKIS